MAGPEHFGPEPFDPATAKDRNRFAHLPFGGPRSSIGAHLGLAELIVAVATAVRAFRLHSLDARPVISALNLGPALRCRLSRADASDRG